MLPLEIVGWLGVDGVVTAVVAAAVVVAAVVEGVALALLVPPSLAALRSTGVATGRIALVGVTSESLQPLSMGL